ncbi:hypothetical protein TIFTF001_008436 [Ficus carica]|uniref:Glycosyltransferase n=1 Tax=Ficus carica TaxID=3494 RepID=A0AA88CXY7_FICCA|nr:hypothetical protein TIFTF001_008436 [Ficus carica]
MDQSDRGDRRMTNCGWNSIMKNICLGVPLLCFPIVGDHFTNRKLVVDDWRVELDRYDQKPLTRSEVAEKIVRHVTPSVQLALKLASKGFTITFVNTQVIHHQLIKSQPHSTSAAVIEDDIFAGARELGLDIRYKTMTDGFPLEVNRILNPQFVVRNFLSLPAHVDELVGDLVESDPSVSCLIADTCYTWASEIAQKYKLVNISFWTQPALVFNIYHHMDLIITNGHYPPQDNRKGTIDYIPGVRAIEPKDLPSYLQETNTVAHQFLDKAFKEVKNADFILCNTIEELESNSMSTLQEKNQPIYAIGPLIDFSNEFTKRNIVPTSMRTELNCTQWLNTKPHGSVLYVSFGSSIPSKVSDIEEIAHGLVLSGVNFVWVLRRDAVSFEEPYVLPIEIQDEIKDKGLVLTWTNQIEVLSHPSIGGFLTHCGWNSVLESLWCSGVPLLCFPLRGDQITNRKIVVDDWRIGLNLCDRKPLTRSEVAEKITRLMSENSADELKKEVIKVSQMVLNALAIDGSSEKSSSDFVVDVKAKLDGHRNLKIPQEHSKPFHIKL